jgi:predicted MPP superfamily phosphohydrolase
MEMKNIRILNESDKRDFKSESSFPGVEGNPFDIILRSLQKINNIPLILFLVLLILIEGSLTLFQLNKWLLLSIFSIVDILIIRLLPILKISFGSFKSQVLLLAFLRAIFIWLPYPVNLILQSIGVLLVIYGFLIEPSKIKLTTIQKSFGNKNQALRFFHISDIHLERFGIRESKIIDYIKERKPDFILYTGDFLNLSNLQDQKSIIQVIDLFNEISKFAPTYYVTGSPAVDMEETISKIEKSMKAIRLQNENLTYCKNNTELNLIGITCSHRPFVDIEQLSNLIDSNLINILLYHSPDLIYEIETKHKISLMLSGHTHGGQVRIPYFGAIFTGSLYGRKLQSGLYKIHDTLLYISRGIGLEGMGAPRVRFLCPPEIIEWNINL